MEKKLYYDKLLPLGSVVKVNNKKYLYMIVQNNFDDKFDYLGIEYPNGFSDEEGIVKFNIDDIDEIYFIGYFDKYVYGDLVKKNIDKMINNKTEKSTL